MPLDVSFFSIFFFSILYFGLQFVTYTYITFFFGFPFLLCFFFLTCWFSFVYFDSSIQTYFISFFFSCRNFFMFIFFLFFCGLWNKKKILNNWWVRTVNETHQTKMVGCCFFFLILNSDWKKLCFLLFVWYHILLLNTWILCAWKPVWTFSMRCAMKIFVVGLGVTACCVDPLRTAFYSGPWGERDEGDNIKFTDIWTNLPSFEVHIVFYLSQNCTKYIIIEKLWKKKVKRNNFFSRKNIKRCQ